MNDTASLRTGAARLRMVYLRAGALLTAICALTALPTSADASGPKPARSQPSVSPRCRDAHARLDHVSRADTERATLCLLNRQRSAHGLPSLRGSGRLDASAQRWTDTMVHDRAFSHGSDFGARISAAGFRWSRIGENIAAGYRTPSGVVGAWMRSLGHCENILSPDYREVGSGFAPAATGGAGTRGGTWTLDLGLRIGQRTLSTDWTPAEHCPD